MSSYSLVDLCDLADVTPRTVRYYIAQGLLRPPTGGGPAARYDDGHLYRLRLIRRLQKEHLPLAEIRTRLAAVSDAEVERIAEEPRPVTDSAADYVARVLSARGLAAAPTPSPTQPRTQAPVPAQAPRHVVREAASMSNDASPAEPPPRSQWERLVLHPDIELHIRRPLSRAHNRRVERLIDAARTILEEDQP